MLLNDKIQIPFVNKGTVELKAGDPVVDGTASSYQAVFGVVVADVKPGESGLLETSGIFSFNADGVKNIRKYQQIYCVNNASGTVTFTPTPQNAFVFAGISLTDRVNEGGPLVLAVGYNSPVYKAAASGATSNPSGGGAGAMSDSSTTVDPSNSSEPGAM